MNKFKKEVEQNEESTREKLQTIKDGLIKWQEFFRNDGWVYKNLVFDYTVSCLITQPILSLFFSACLFSCDDSNIDLVGQLAALPRLQAC